MTKKMRGVLPNLSLELASGRVNEKLKLPDIHLNSSIKSVAACNRIVVTSEFEVTHSKPYSVNKTSASSAPVVDISQKFLKFKNVYPTESFGLQDILFDSQPSMQLISIGCECILILKEFFIQNSSVEYLKRLRQMVYPFPELKEIEANYARHVKWKKFTDKVLNTSLQNSARPVKFN